MPQQHNNMMKITTVIVSAFGPALCAELVPDPACGVAPTERLPLGETLGLALGLPLGDTLGLLDGDELGDLLGLLDGNELGGVEGLALGALDGAALSHVTSAAGVAPAAFVPNLPVGQAAVHDVAPGW